MKFELFKVNGQPIKPEVDELTAVFAVVTEVNRSFVRPRYKTEGLRNQWPHANVMYVILSAFVFKRTSF
jgi:hypothetical protein